MRAYTLYDGPFAHPRTCVCGSTDGPMVDTHREILRYGRVYLCRRCIGMAADVFDFVPRETLRELEERATSAERETAAIRTTVSGIATELQQAVREALEV